MLASPPVRAAVERAGSFWPPLGAAAVCFCAVFFGSGLSAVTLVWIGGLALLLAALLAAAALLGALPAPQLDGPGALFCGSPFRLPPWGRAGAAGAATPARPPGPATKSAPSPPHTPAR